ncbi:MAG: SMP-30/gluconolactonase/LRE family protein [Rhodospirillales bacterium]|nr:SMP-30/gluconolactonase/LRE family protein [Rhodospirillales bacterium]
MAAGSESPVRLCDPAGALLGEGPVWHVREQALYWVDIKGQRLHRYHPADHTAQHWALHGQLAWALPRRDGGFVAGISNEIGILKIEPELSFTPRLSVEPDLPGNRLNDAKTDIDGSLWFGSMDDNHTVPSGNFYQLRSDFSTLMVDTGYTIANGPAISRDGRYIYHTDSAARTIYRYTRTLDGKLERRAPFIYFDEADGFPDGMTVDTQGGLWVAHWGGGRVSRFTADGTFDRALPLPVSQVSSCCFGGAQLDRLFVTTASIGLNGTQRATEPLAGALFELTPDMEGIPCQDFAG